MGTLEGNPQWTWAWLEVEGYRIWSNVKKSEVVW
jgi:hypothetical protein